MSERSHEFERFVRRAHRRWVAWRALERVGFTTLAACALSLPLIVLLWSQGGPALVAVAIALGVGVFVGAIWGILHRPTLLDTAVEADRQFHLHDLLGTALTLSRCAYADDAARSMVCALADERCRRLAASRLILNQLGARAWGGIGLATALVITLALMTTSPTSTVARAGAVDLVSGPAGASRQRPPADVAPPPQSDNRRAMLPPSSGSRGPSENAARADPSEHSPAREPSNASGSSDGAGSAHARTDATVRFDLHPNTPRREATDGTPPAGGAGIPLARRDLGDDPAMTGHARSTRSNTAAWQSHTWAADRARALRDVERGAIPDAYGDLVRAYFSDGDE